MFKYIYAKRFTTLSSYHLFNITAAWTTEKCRFCPNQWMYINILLDTGLATDVNKYFSGIH